MKDLTLANISLHRSETSPKLNRNNSSSFLTNNLNSSFLSQIQEENGDLKNSQSFNNSNDRQLKAEMQNTFSYKSDFAEQANKIFHSTNKLPYNLNNLNANNNSKALKKQQKDSNYQHISGNYISSNGSGGLVTTSIGPPQLAFNNIKDKNNLSILSSSTVDSKDMEVIFENTTTANNKNLISTMNPTRTNLNGKNPFVNSIAPPGQVISNQGYKINSRLTSSNNEIINLESNMAKRQTQGIAAIAAQRKAFQHHRELMQELEYETNTNKEDLTTSRLATHDQSNEDKYEEFLEKKNSVLTDNNIIGNKTKKQVKIKDIVQYKLPDENAVGIF